MIINKAYIEDVIYGRKKSFCIGSFLRLLSIAYGMIVLFRHALFFLGIIRQRRLRQRVISVGNITLGGTGKTPCVVHIADVLLKHRKRPVVLSRGYGRRNESDIIVVADGNRVCADSHTGGDEPVLIGSKVRGLPVVAGSDRFSAGLFAYEKFHNDVVLLDDGFQHIRLRRDLDIVLIDGADPFGSGKLFPRGILREPLSALRRAHVVLITGSDRCGDPESVKKTIRRHTEAKIFTSRQVAVDLIDIMSGELSPLSALRGKQVLAVAGIARPASFVSLLESIGAEIKATSLFPDHYPYTQSDMAVLFERAAVEHLSMIVTTEKDAVRMRHLGPKGIRALRIEMNVLEKEAWEAVLLNNG